MTAAPPVAVVVPTRDRPELLRLAAESVVAQDYPGQVDVLVVHDGTEPDRTLESTGPRRRVQVLANTRSPGLAGARNSGICATSRPLVAFCDDDDTWLPGKLAAQVATMVASPDVEMCCCGVEIDFDGRSNRRLVGADVVTHGQLLRSRMAMLHSSTFLFRREALIDGIGLVDECIPGGQSEDWDLLLRASARRPVAVVDRPLVRVRWGRTSHYARQWRTKAASLSWMLAHHPDIESDPVGAARVYGQMGFALAADGRRRDALSWAARAVRRHPAEWRAVATAVVVLRLASADRILDTLHRFGRGV
ncbi:MAG: glycosyltransferase family 2 protein [Mycobacteriales bacterium]